MYKMVGGSAMGQKSGCLLPSNALHTLAMIVDDNQDNAGGAGEAAEPTIKAREVVYCGICTFPPEVPSFSFSY